MFSKDIIINYIQYTIKAPSSIVGKKYDVFLGSKYLLSFGILNQSHYKDRLGIYSSNDNMNTVSRDLYRLKNKKFGRDTTSPIYWSKRYLW